MEKINITIDQLRSVQGSEITNQAVSLTRILISERHPEAERIIKGLMIKPGLDPLFTAGLISNLKSFPNQDTEGLLIRYLTDPNRLIRTKAAGSLLQVGTPASLPQIERAIPQNRNLAFLHTVISHRFGLPSPYLRIPEASEFITVAGRTSPIQGESLAPETQREINTGAVQSDLQLGTFSGTGLKITCSGGSSALVVHKSSTDTGISSLLRSRPSVLGTILLQDEENKEWAFSRMILGGPLDATRFYVGVYRRDGQLVLFGTGNHGDTRMTLSSVNNPGATPTIIQASWVDDKLELSGASANTRQPALQPTPVNRRFTIPVIPQ